MQTYPLSNKVFTILDNFNTEVIHIELQYYKPGSKLVVPIIKWYEDILHTILNLKTAFINTCCCPILETFGSLVNLLTNILYIYDPKVTEAFIHFCENLVLLIHWKPFKSYLYTILDYWVRYSKILPIKFSYVNNHAFYHAINNEDIGNLILCNGSELDSSVTSITLPSNPLFKPNVFYNEIVNVQHLLNSLHKFLYFTSTFLENSFLCTKMKVSYQKILTLGANTLKKIHCLKEIIDYINFCITLFYSSTFDNTVIHSFLIFLYDFHNVITDINVKSFVLTLLAWWLNHKKILNLNFNLLDKCYSSTTLDFSQFHFFNLTFPYDSLYFELKSIR